jgi:hypothetical protein
LNVYVIRDFSSTAFLYVAPTDDSPPPHPWTKATVRLELF